MSYDDAAAFLAAADPADAVGFWRAAGQEKWFSKDDAFDAEFRDRYIGQHLAAAARALDGWLATPEGALALVLLTDQFPRNSFRGTGHMYATDSLARYFARQALAAGHDERFEKEMRLFFYLPFGHSEELADQDLSVALIGRLGEPWLAHAEQHRGIVRRFGRFPHRNPMLGRETTTEEAAFLAAGGFQG
jgi:uncharacterized protein (DUF924 family)